MQIVRPPVPAIPTPKPSVGQFVVNTVKNIFNFGSGILPGDDKCNKWIPSEEEIEFNACTEREAAKYRNSNQFPNWNSIYIKCGKTETYPKLGKMGKC
jgi:hypothetical protein